MTAPPTIGADVPTETKTRKVLINLATGLEDPERVTVNAGGARRPGEPTLARRQFPGLEIRAPQRARLYRSRGDRLGRKLGRDDRPALDLDAAHAGAREQHATGVRRPANRDTEGEHRDRRGPVAPQETNDGADAGLHGRLLLFGRNDGRMDDAVRAWSRRQWSVRPVGAASGTPPDIGPLTLRALSTSGTRTARGPHSWLSEPLRSARPWQPARKSWLTEWTHSRTRVSVVPRWSVQD
jgi:hypothetical protein